MYLFASNKLLFTFFVFGGGDVVYTFCAELFGGGDVVYTFCVFGGGDVVYTFCVFGGGDVVSKFSKVVFCLIIVRISNILLEKKL
jgi:hypothetical protein